MRLASVHTLLIAATSLLLSACSTLPPAGITPVTGFEPARYTGKWYEIARLDHVFERGLSDVSADYTQKADGSIRVLNRGYDTAGARWKEAEGRALFNTSPDVASLKVSFFGPFFGGYHVVALDPHYQWALVAGNNRDYLWILAREKTLPADIKTALLAQAAALGYATEKLIWVTQTRPDA
ncbi:lipocalin family protein [Crenobacter intestini]|uniref:Outer membrane lipoprotein Blc n=1 Tax=Crenobacter intestini TaxID=2563443 RepID=A0A4V4N7R3_9NEIS|nr:lipocalin family protein [Crenobacter intestini]TIC81363.1 lipocalin [Crenobacter intestini]